MIDSTKDGKSKAIAVGAYDAKTGNIVTSFAKAIPNNIHPELLKRANEIGGIGTHGLTERNIVGVCAEFHVVNELLLKGSKWSDIRLTSAIRPRTGQKIPFCANCKKMFYDIKDKGE
jgi:filamentous hemagglutinin